MMVKRQCIAASNALSTFSRLTTRDTSSRVRHELIRQRRQLCASSQQITSSPSSAIRTQLIATPASRARSIPQAAAATHARSFTTSLPQRHGDILPPKPGEERHVTFIDKDGSSHTFEVADGNNLLDIAQANDLEMEGACGGSCACSTCHVIVTGQNGGSGEDMYDKMEEPSDDENDMLDLAFGLTETSRLGCQVEMSKKLDGLVVSPGTPRVSNSEAR